MTPTLLAAVMCCAVLAGCSPGDLNASLGGPKTSQPDPLGFMPEKPFKERQAEAAEALAKAQKEAADTASANEAALNGGALRAFKNAERATLETTPADPGWSHSYEKDAMTGSGARFATIDSINRLDFPAPYSGGSQGSMMVRERKKDGLKVLFSISRGQIICLPQCQVRIRFDEKPPMTFTGSLPADYSSEYIFLAPASKLVAELAKAKTTRVEVTYYQAGAQVSEFNTSGFSWGKGG
jgi:hypothetical protein